MQETIRAKVKDEWIVCGKCGHKLGRIVGKKLPAGLEIKCHSCKELNLLEYGQKSKVKQDTVPHCKHCKNFHTSTGDCILLLQERVKNGSRFSAKAAGSRYCKRFEAKEEYKENYKEIEK